jgi:hypothetical protein
MNTFNISGPLLQLEGPVTSSLSMSQFSDQARIPQNWSAQSSLLMAVGGSFAPPTTGQIWPLGLI